MIDAGTGAVLYEKAADDPVAPAATVKILTAEIVFRELAEGRLKLEDEFTFPITPGRTAGRRRPAGRRCSLRPTAACASRTCCAV